MTDPSPTQVEIDALVARCSLCGEPMPKGEEMFKFHGYSGPCPKPPLPKPTIAAVIEYYLREADGQFWLDIHVDRVLHSSFPFATAAGRGRALDDLLDMMRSVGASDVTWVGNG